MRTVGIIIVAAVLSFFGGGIVAAKIYGATAALGDKKIDAQIVAFFAGLTIFGTLLFAGSYLT